MSSVQILPTETRLDKMLRGSAWKRSSSSKAADEFAIQRQTDTLAQQRTKRKTAKQLLADKRLIRSDGRVSEAGHVVQDSRQLDERAFDRYRSPDRVG
jgi:hypothetical protein